MSSVLKMNWDNRKCSPAPAFATAPDTGTRNDARGTTDWRDYQLSDSATSYVLWENATVNIDE